MCCCGRPVVNGEPGYRWQPNDAPIVRDPRPPALAEGDVLLFDEPGRCGGTDSHSYHYRVVTAGPWLYLLVCHGGGEDRIRIKSSTPFKGMLGSLDSTDRYWLLNTLYHTCSEARITGQDQERTRWCQAAVDGRIKKRKARGQNTVTVSIEPALT